MKLSHALIPAALVVALSACSGQVPVSPEATPTSAAPVPVGTAGIYDVDFGQFTGVYALLDDGRFYGLHFLGDTLAGHPHGQLSDGDTATSQEPITWANFVDDGRRVGTMEPAGTFGRRFTESEVKVAITGSMGSFSASAVAQKPWAPGSAETLYGTPLDSLAGDYAGIVRSVGLGLKQEQVASLVFDESNGFTVEALECSLAGTVERVGDTGVFDVVAHASGSQCGLEPELRGLVVPLSIVDGEVTLAIELDTDDGTQSAVFIVTLQ